MLFANRNKPSQLPQGPAAIIVVFTMTGCGACEEYIPRFNQIAAQFPSVPRYIVNASTPQGAQYADHFSIEGTPTTMVLRKPAGAIRAEGALANTDIQQLFAIAAARR